MCMLSEGELDLQVIFVCFFCFVLIHASSCVGNYVSVVCLFTYKFVCPAVEIDLGMLQYAPIP